MIFLCCMLSNPMAQRVTILLDQHRDDNRIVFYQAPLPCSRQILGFKGSGAPLVELAPIYSYLYPRFCYVS